MKYQGLREVRKVTQYKNGCIYRTEHVGYAYQDIDDKRASIGDTLYCSVSTSVSRNLAHNVLFRAVADDTPNLVTANVKEN